MIKVKLKYPRDFLCLSCMEKNFQFAISRDIAKQRTELLQKQLLNNLLASIALVFVIECFLSIEKAKRVLYQRSASWIYCVSNFNNVRENLPIGCATLTEFEMSSSCKATDIPENSIHTSRNSVERNFAGLLVRRTRISWKIK